MNNGHKSLKNLDKSVTIVGLGKIGLPLAVLSALRGYRVFGIDVSVEQLEKIRDLDQNTIEPTVSFFLQDQQVIDNLSFHEKIVEKTDFFVICVQTFLDENKKICTTFVEQAIFDLIPFLKIGCTIILESSVQVGFTRRIAQIIEANTNLKIGIDIYLAYSPERLLPGQAFKELIFNDRIIGGYSEICSSRAGEFFLPMAKGEVFLTTLETAELCKIAENTFRAVQIALANQIDDVCRRVGVDTFTLLELASKHPRVKFVQPGIGVGGDCVPVHPYFLKESIEDFPALIDVALRVNEDRTMQIVKDISLEIHEFLLVKSKKNPIVLVLGLTYKPNVMDLRNSPALKIAQELSKIGNIYLKVYDPFVEINVIHDAGLESLTCFSEYKSADILVFLVGHDKFVVFREVDLSGKWCIDPIGFLRKNHTEIVKREVINK